jgi:hypothetical protein
MVETDLVRALVLTGVYPKRAAAFERCLDDSCYCGISGTLLGRHCLLYARRVAFGALEDYKLLDATRRIECVGQLEMFEHLAYAGIIARPARTRARGV